MKMKAKPGVTPLQATEQPRWPANHPKLGEWETQPTDTCEPISSCCLTSTLTSPHPHLWHLLWQPRKLIDIPTHLL